MDKLIELAVNASPLALLFLLVLALSKLYIDVVLKRQLQKEEHSNQKQIEEVKHDFESERIRLKNDYEYELNKHIKNIDATHIKITKVLDILERINLQLANLHAFYATYFAYLKGKSSLGKSEEDVFVKIHQNILDEFGRLKAYVPCEIAYILKVFLRMMSSPIAHGKPLYNIFMNEYDRSSMNYPEMINACYDFVRRYFDAYDELVYQYMYGSLPPYEGDIALTSILKKHDITIDPNEEDFKESDLPIRFIRTFIFYQL